MNSFSRSVSGSKATFKRHHVHEVATSLIDSKHIANDIRNANRYAYRARVTLVGFAGLRPYDPIYLDGLTNGFSGYWTVLSVRHIFGGAPLRYMLDVEVGTDALGDINVDASKAAQFRDVQGELSGQVVTPPEPVLADIAPRINKNSLAKAAKTPITTKVKPHALKIPDTAHPDFYHINTPTPIVPKKESTWKASSNTSKGRVGR